MKFNLSDIPERLLPQIRERMKDLGYSSIAQYLAALIIEDIFQPEGPKPDDEVHGKQ